MRCAVIADSHFDASRNGRLAECVRLHDWIADDVSGRSVDVILHAGDLFERKSVPADRNAAAAWLQRCAHIAPVALIRGNHDVVGDLQLFSQLRAPYPIVVEEQAGVHRLEGGLAIGCLSWPRKAELLARLGRRVSYAQADEASRTALTDVLRGIGRELSLHEGPTVLLAHAMVRGSRVGPGQPLVGCPFELSLADLALSNADFIALGHVHAGQDWEHRADREPRTIAYPGSPRRTAYGEAEPKGYLLVDFERRGDRWEAQWQRIEIPAPPMVLLEVRWAEGDMRAPDGAPLQLDRLDLDDADVRLRYQVDAEQRAAARLAAAELEAALRQHGASHVKPEECINVTTVARLPEVTAAKSTADALVALWYSANDIAAQRQTSLLAKLDELERTAA